MPCSANIEARQLEGVSAFPSVPARDLKASARQVATLSYLGDLYGMGTATLADFVESIRGLRLLEPSQLAELARLQAQIGDSQRLARALLERDWLTAFQANLLMQGRSANLLLGQYILLERTGANSLGQVYKARHQVMKRPVTLQVVREELLTQPETVEQFYSEVQAVSQLSHPNLIAAYDAGPVGSTHFFATEYLFGSTLEMLVLSTGVCSVIQASSYILQTALGLQHAYERGLRHHDLKPANLLLVPRKSSDSLSSTSLSNTHLDPSVSEQIKICNLGLSMIEHRPGATGTGRQAVSLDSAYAAPEQLLDPPTRDIRSDLYSLGGVFYYLLSGRPPGPAAGIQAQLAALAASRPDVPEPILAIMGRLLAEQPEERFQTPAEVGEVLYPIVVPKAKPRAVIEYPDDSALEHSPTPDPVDPLSLIFDSTEIISKPSSVITEPPPQALATPPTRRRSRWTLMAVCIGSILIGLLSRLLMPISKTAPAPHPRVTPGLLEYVKRATRQQTILETLKANGVPTLEGPWYFFGPIDNTDGKAVAVRHPPEAGVDFSASSIGPNGQTITWQPVPDFEPGRILTLAAVTGPACVYLYQEIESDTDVDLPVSLGSGGTLAVWLNQDSLLDQRGDRAVMPAQHVITLPLRSGKNQLLVKVCSQRQPWGFILSPQFPEKLQAAFGENLTRSFGVYRKQATRQQTILATLRANGISTLEGPWYHIGPFDNRDGKGFATVYPPEQEIALANTYKGTADSTVSWKVYEEFRVGQLLDFLPLYQHKEKVCLYLYHEIKCARPVELPVSFGSDDTLSVWLNRQVVISNNVGRKVMPDQDIAVLRLQAGSNHLLIKICTNGGGWAGYMFPLLPSDLRDGPGLALLRDFPGLTLDQGGTP